MGARIVGISVDRSDRQKEFDDKNDLGFPLLSDRSKAVAKLFGVKRIGMLPNQRATFVIGQDRRVLGVVRSEMSMTAHADQALEVLKAAA